MLHIYVMMIKKVGKIWFIRREIILTSERLSAFLPPSKSKRHILSL